MRKWVISGSWLKDDRSLVNAPDYDYRTPLHVAASNNCLASAKILVANGCLLNAQDRWGNSPLADAEGAGFQEMSKLLRKNGALLIGGSGNHCDVVAVAPPLPQKCDWEIDPSEVDLNDSLLIGKGSFGEIRKATWRGTPVAVKTIRPSLSTDRAVVKDFRHEVELLVKVRHPNIVQFLGAVTERQPMMLVTEYLASGDLHDLLKRKEALPASDAVKFALDMARGMTYLHSGPNVIIHRDLKPRNLIFDESMELKVADFGLSKLIKVKHLHEVYKLTGETGSYRYMAPEVFEHAPYDTSVDVFSFAMILYEMIEGTAPFDDMGAYEAAQVVARENLRPVLRAKTYPSGMKELINKCWSEYPDKRPRFEEIVQQLESIQEGLPQDRIHLRDLLHLRRNGK